MRVLRVHNRYQERGGEDVSFDAEVRLLQQHGEDVYPLVVSNTEIPDRRTPLMSLDLAVGSVWSRNGRKLVQEAIQHFQPDIAHFDNVFPLISPAAYFACRDAGVAVVQTLHNYRLLCPAATFFRDGRCCEDCLGKMVPLPGVIHGCYRESRSQSTAVASMITAHRILGTWKRSVNRYIALSDFARLKFIDGGFPSERITVKPNFVDAVDSESKKDGENFLFVGRLSKEKGILTLLAAWHEVGHLSLTVVGDGPLRQMVESTASAHPGITFLGRLPSDMAYVEAQTARAVVFPSELYETFGRVVIEAFSQGTPVIASRLGAIAELVEEGVTGLLFEAGNVADLVAKVRWAADHPEEMSQMGTNARREYELKYTPRRNYEMLVEIYRQAIGHV